MTEILKDLEKMKNELGGSFASVNIYTPKGFVTITIQDNDDSEDDGVTEETEVTEEMTGDPKPIVPETVDEVKETLKKTYDHSCKRCGKFFRDTLEGTRICPECKLKKARERRKKYEDKQKEIRKTAREVMNLA